MEPFDADEYSDWLGEHKGEYETVLWTGRDEDGYSCGDYAREMCEAHNESIKDESGNYIEGEKPWMTNEMLLEEATKEKNMEMPPDYNPDASDEEQKACQDAWDSASKATVDNADGDVKVLVGANNRGDESTYSRVEKDALEGNTDVKAVDEINVNTNTPKKEDGTIDLNNVDGNDITHYERGADGKLGLDSGAKIDGDVEQSATSGGATGAGETEGTGEDSTNNNGQGIGM